MIVSYSYTQTLFVQYQKRFQHQAFQPIRGVRTQIKLNLNTISSILLHVSIKNTRQEGSNPTFSLLLRAVLNSCSTNDIMRVTSVRVSWFKTL